MSRLPLGEAGSHREADGRLMRVAIIFWVRTNGTGIRNIICGQKPLDNGKILHTRGGGGIGRRNGLKIRRW